MPLPANLALNPDEYFDYYELLDQPQDATIAELRGRINDLYAEAQANRDHRNPQKRREYLLWLDVLPQMRSILTDETKRAKYDVYRQSMISGAEVTPYAEFLREVEGKPKASSEEASVLGLREDTVKAPIAAPVKVPKAPAAGPPAAAVALGALIVVAGIAYVVKHDIGIALIAGAVVAAIVFLVMRGSNKVAL